MAESENVEKLPSILDGTFFKVIKIANGKVVANCLNCINNQISGSLTATSNFLRHIKVTIPVV